MAVGTQVKQWRTEAPARTSRSRRWMVAAAIAIAAAGTGIGIFAATNSSEAGTSVVSSPEVAYVDPGLEARQDALKRFHQDARPVSGTGSTSTDPQSALKRYHEDNLGR